MSNTLRSAASKERGLFPLFSRLLQFDVPEVWVRFLLAIVGLGMAFAAALFSTVARESGSMWGTLVLASMALVLAVVVGLTTVPYLARRVAAARLRNAFDYEVTRVGLVYVAIVALIGIAALNTGNNLLYIVVAALLSAILVSGVASAAVLRDLELDVRVPEHVFAGRSARVRILLRNPRRWLASFSVSVVALGGAKARKHWEWSPATFAFPPWRPPQNQWLRLPDKRLRRVAASSGPPSIFRGPAYFPHVPPKTELSAELELSFAKRGRYQQEGFRLATRFPFAFLVKTRQLPLAREIVVYPPVEPPDEFFEVLPLITGELETFTRGRGTDLYRIREYTPEDSARHVDWKATARTGSLKVREFSREDERKIRIVFDNPAPAMISAAAYEKAINLAASLGWHFAANNIQTSFVSQGFESGQDLYRFLAWLAVIKPQRVQSVIESLPQSSDYNIILSARPRGSVPTNLWAGSYFIFIGERDSPADAVLPVQ